MPHESLPERSRLGSRGLLARRKRERPGRTGRLAVEALEARWMPSLTVQFADAVAASGGGSVDTQSNAVTNDAAGNVFVTGSFQGTADFDPGSGVANLNSTGGRDVFFAKYSKTGALLWAKDLRGADDASVGQGAAVVLDASGNVLVSGTFTGTVNFDPNAGDTSLSAPGRNDVFIAKYDSGGGLIWARSAAGTAGTIATGYALAVDAAGNVAAAGSFQGTAAFGSTTLTAGGSFDGFVAKLDPSGQFLWAKATSGSGTSVAQAAGLTFDASGNVVATGFFAGGVTFNPAVNALSLTSNGGSRDVFVQKIDSAGNVVWAVSVGSADIDQGNGVVADTSGNLYVTGTFAAAADFNTDTGTFNLTPGGFQDPFLLKLNSAGQFVWAKDFALTGFNAGQGTGVALDASGHVFVAGYFQGKMTFDASTSLTSAGSFDAFVAEFDATGNTLAVFQGGGTNFDAGFGIGVNASGQVAIAGRYSGPASFGTSTLPAQPGKSIFIVELNSSSGTVVAPSAPSGPVLQAASDSGLSQADRFTNYTTLTFDVNTAVAGNLVELLRDGVVVGSRTGPGPVTDAGPVPNGVHSYTARQTDANARVSLPSAGTSVTESLKAPPTPGVPLLLAADDSGAKGDATTNVKSPRYSGTVEPNSVIQLFDLDWTFFVQAYVAADGTYLIQVPVTLADGNRLVRVREMDVAGNLSAIGASTPLVIDSTPPPAPSSLSLLSADDSGALGDGITDNKQPRLSGTAEAGSTIRLINPSGALLGAATVATGGAYTVSPSAPLSDGTYALRTQALDAAGNLGAPSASFSLTIQTSPNLPATPSTPTLLAADDSGAKGDGLTNVKQPRLVGTATAGLTVQVLNASGTAVGSAVVAADGSYSVAPGSPLADGFYSFQARASDAPGNSSTPSASLSLAIDATPPAVPSSPTLPAADDSGARNDGITNVKSPRFTGTAEAGSTVQLINAAGNVVGTAVATSGAYSVSPSSPLSDGTHSLRAQAIDAAGNLGAASVATPITIDATAPAAPTTPSLLPADDSGQLGDGVTNVKSPRFTGTAEAGSTVQLINTSGTVLGTAVATGGAYTVSPSTPLADGAHSLRAQAIDAAGNLGTASNAINLTIDSTPPVVPTTPSLLAADDSGAKGDGITNVNEPRLVGTAAAGVTVQVVNAGGTVLGSAATAADGSYSVSLGSALADGAYSLRARSIDLAGNTSASSPAFALAIDTSALAAPTTPGLFAGDDSGVKGDGVTSARQPRIFGLAEPGSTVQVFSITPSEGVGTAAILASGTAALDGGYLVGFVSPQADGAYSIVVRATDAAGNVSPTSGALSLTIDTAQPATPPAPKLLPADDSGTAGDSITSVNQPRFTGTAEAGSTIQLINAAGNLVGATTASPSGAYTVAPSSPLADGTYALRVVALDPAGNASLASPAATVTILSSAPAAPSPPAFAAADDSGAKGDGITNVRQPRLGGTAGVGLTVQLLNASGTLIGSTIAASDGTYLVAPTALLGDGSYSVQVRAVGATGALSPLSGTFAFTIDSTPPAAPSAPTLMAADDSGAPGDGITSARQPRFIGTAVAGTTVRLIDAGGLVLGTATATNLGAYTLSPAAPLGDATYSLRVQALDVAGNLSTASSALGLTIDTTPPLAPPAPTLLAADDTGTLGDGITTVTLPRLVGTAEAGPEVQWLDGSGNVIGRAAAGADGKYTIQPLSPLGVGTYAVTIRAVDAAGNGGFPGPVFSLIVIATGLATPSAPVLNAADDSSPLGDGRTAVRLPRLTGTTQPGLRVELLDGSGLVLGTTTASASSGEYSVQPSANLPAGALSLRARVRDASGNVSASSTPLNLSVVDATAADFEGDGKTDLSLYRPSTTQWIATYSNGSGFLVQSYGGAGLTDIPVPGDYDGTGRTQLAVFRPTTAQWFVIGASGGRQLATYGLPNLSDVPLTAPIASLKKLGKIGGIRLAAQTNSLVSRTAAQVVAPAPDAAKSLSAEPGARPAVAEAALPAPVVPARPRPRQAVVPAARPRNDHVSFALDHLVSEHAARRPFGLKHGR